MEYFSREISISCWTCELHEYKILQIRESKSFKKRSWWKKMWMKDPTELNWVHDCSLSFLLYLEWPPNLFFYMTKQIGLSFGYIDRKFGRYLFLSILNLWSIDWKLNTYSVTPRMMSNTQLIYHKFLFLYLAGLTILFNRR